MVVEPKVSVQWEGKLLYSGHNLVIIMTRRVQSFVLCCVGHNLLTRRQRASRVGGLKSGRFVVVSSSSSPHL